jgi:hypothetical protein
LRVREEHHHPEHYHSEHHHPHDDAQYDRAYDYAAHHDDGTLEHCDTSVDAGHAAHPERIDDIPLD